MGPEASSFWGKRPVFRASPLEERWGQRGPFCSKLGRTQIGRKEPACHPKSEWEVLEPCERVYPSQDLYTSSRKIPHRAGSPGLRELGFREQGRKCVKLEAVLIRTGERHR